MSILLRLFRQVTANFRYSARKPDGTSIFRNDIPEIHVDSRKSGGPLKYAYRHNDSRIESTISILYVSVFYYLKWYLQRHFQALR